MELIPFYSEQKYEIYEGNEFIGYLQKTVRNNVLVSVLISGIDGNTLYENDEFQVDDIEDAPIEFQSILTELM